MSLGSSNTKDVVMQDDEMASLYAAYGEDPELAFALKMSMMEEEAKKLVVPDEPEISVPGSVNIQLRMPDGSKHQRRFLVTHKIGDIMNFARKSIGGGVFSVKLSTTYPKKYFEDATKTLQDVGLTKNEALLVEIK